ncbi:type II CAAX endopeptidase family protein [Clostridium sp. OS1-26]|uniref:CPBP family intramembrane glutamic endopeptidase n=1 Tax=Clostridium sp. OS1-26 TaxID=3070681 RepID=UPI0027DF1504|nr:type II CAAX endopeptidase family protein [Clostridium sp. OS1-26]WML34396.1 type II CAAX endopeptidase family protein [Clostridium sp. OS1-26]
MKSIFINKDAQLRSGFKVLLALITVILSIILFSSLYGTLLHILFKDQVPKNEWLTILEKIILDGSFTLIPLAFWKWIDKKPFQELGLISVKKGSRSIVSGIIWGSISMTFVFIILIGCGSSYLVNSLSSPEISQSLIIGLIINMFVGFSEELFFRGYLLTILADRKNKLMALIVSSLIFSLMHMGNPNIKPLALINIFLLGLLLGFLYLKSSNIWMPVGFHIAWNYVQGYIWGFQLSGGETQGLYQTQFLHESILNGGKFGPEGGLVVTLILILSFILAKIYFKNKNSQ